MSKILDLAELLDELVVNGLVHLSEHSSSLIVSNINELNLKKILPLCSQLGWITVIRDNASEVWEFDQITEGLEPFRLNIEKPKGADEQIFVLTNTGFEKLLLQEFTIFNWRIARLNHSIKTESILLQPWAGEETAEPSSLLKNPRSLVKEYTNSRTVPADIRSWLLKGDVDLTNTAASVWANVAARLLLRSICNEIDPENNHLKFKGLPKLELTQDGSASFIASLGEKAFLKLQEAARWVYENEREAEMRHTLLSTECGRSGSALQSAAEFASKFIDAALDSARIAYQMSLSDTSKDTLKVLADLRKAISEETSKATETTRQLASAITAAIAVGIGLLITRITTATPPTLIIGIMLVVVVYVAVVIFSGVQFISIQKTLRREWQPRLYRFIPIDEYTKLVINPTSRSEKTFYISAAMSGVAVIALAILVIFQSLSAPYSAANSTPNKVASPPSSSSSQFSASIIAPNHSATESKAQQSSSISTKCCSSISHGVTSQSFDNDELKPK